MGEGGEICEHQAGVDSADLTFRNTRSANGGNGRHWLERDHPAGPALTSASLIGHSGSSAFRLSTTPVSMSLAGSRFSSLIGHSGSSAFRLSKTPLSI